MTLDEAIVHAKELSENQSVCNDCREEHKQLAKWLEELKKYKAKELGWLEEEKQQETNYEHFKDEIIQNVKYALAVVNGEPKQCADTNCDECEFNESGKCVERVIEWLNKQHKKPTYKLSQFEYDLLNTYKDSGMRKFVSYYRALLELHEKGYFKDIDMSIPIYEILENCEVIEK